MNTSAQEEGKDSTWLANLSSNTKAAGQLVAKQTEQTKLANVTLPAAYRDLGRDIHGSGQFQDEFLDLFKAIAEIDSQLDELANRSSSSAEGVGGKLKALAGSAKAAANQQVLQQKRGQAFATLGKAVYDQHGQQAGEAELVAKVKECRSRIEMLDAEIAELSEMGKGQIVTPKRIAIGGLVVVVLVGFWGVSSFFGGGDNPNSVTQGSAASSHATLDDAEKIAKLTQTVKDADALWNEGLALMKKSRSDIDDIVSFDQGRDKLSEALPIYMVVVNADGALPDRATMGRVYGRAIDGNLGLAKNPSVATEIAVKALRRDILPLCSDSDASDIMDAAKRQIKADDRETDEWLNKQRVRYDTSMNGSKKSQPSRSLTDKQRYEVLVSRIRPGMMTAQVAAVLGPPNDKERQDLGDLNPAKRGQILEIWTWETEATIMLSFVNGTLQDGGTPGYDIRKGFKSKLPSNASPAEEAKLRDAARRLGITIIEK